MEKIGVIGAGSWGTALAILLNENGNDVTLVVAPWRRRLRTFGRHREMLKASGNSNSGEHCKLPRILKQAVSREKGACAWSCRPSAVRETAELLK